MGNDFLPVLFPALFSFAYSSTLCRSDAHHILRYRDFLFGCTEQIPFLCDLRKFGSRPGLQLWKHHIIQIHLHNTYRCVSSHWIRPNNYPDPILWSCTTTMTLGTTPTPTLCQDAMGWALVLYPCLMSWWRTYWQMTGRPSVGLRQNGQAQVNKIRFIICVYVCIWCCHQVSLQHVYYYWGFFLEGGLVWDYSEHTASFKHIKAFGYLPCIAKQLLSPTGTITALAVAVGLLAVALLFSIGVIILRRRGQYSREV